jgi:hypothetical protein
MVIKLIRMDGTAGLILEHLGQTRERKGHQQEETVVVIGAAVTMCKV